VTGKGSWSNLTPIVGGSKASYRDTEKGKLFRDWQSPCDEGEVESGIQSIKGVRAYLWQRSLRSKNSEIPECRKMLLGEKIRKLMGLERGGTDESWGGRFIRVKLGEKILSTGLRWSTREHGKSHIKNGKQPSSVGGGEFAGSEKRRKKKGVRGLNQGNSRTPGPTELH